jgi:hypothetical protein
MWIDQFLIDILRELEKEKPPKGGFDATWRKGRFYPKNPLSESANN